MGISLSIQQREFHAADKPIKLQIYPCLTGPFVLPNNYEAASPAYLIQPINRGMPPAVTICLQHHVKLKNKRDCENMRFLLASSTPESSEGRSVYTFKEVNNDTGIFRVEDQKAEITLKVSGLLILAKRDKGIATTAKNPAWYFTDSILLYMYAGDHLYSVRLLQTNTGDNEIEAVLYSCLSHPVYIEVICLISHILCLILIT